MMRRLNDIHELLGAVDDNLLVIRRAYEAARHDDEQLAAARPVIKTVLGDLRSVLDYSAMSIYQSYSTKSWSPHFPYGRDEDNFSKSVAKNLNGLQAQAPEVFALVLSIQPFICGDPWLDNLCSITNTTKHRHLGKQRRINSPMADISIGSLFKVTNGGSITINNCMVDGEILGGGKPIVISDLSTKRELVEIFGHHANVSKSHDWVSFEFEEFAGDVLRFLESSRKHVGIFVSSLNNLIAV